MNEGPRWKADPKASGSLLALHYSYNYYGAFHLLI